MLVDYSLMKICLKMNKLGKDVRGKLSLQMELFRNV